MMVSGDNMRNKRNDVLASGLGKTMIDFPFSLLP